MGNEIWCIFHEAPHPHDKSQPSRFLPAFGADGKPHIATTKEAAIEDFCAGSLIGREDFDRSSWCAREAKLVVMEANHE